MTDPPPSKRGTSLRRLSAQKVTEIAPLSVRSHTRVRRQEFARILLSAVPPSPVARTAEARPKPRANAGHSEPPKSLRRGGGAEGPKSTRGARQTSALEPPKSLRRGAAALPAAVGDRSGLTILVVDDDAAIRELVVKTLASEHLVYQASDGREALDLLRKLPSIDAVVCDVNMPRLDGYGLAKAVKADPALRTIPIILLTARDSPADHVAGIQAGAFFYLTKPFKARDLRTVLSRAQRRG
jgi:CheY-like chemotaxis protein